MRFLLIVALVVAGATWFVGWWSVVLVALVAGYVYRARDGRAWSVALGAASGWAALLLFDAFSGPLAHAATTIGGAMRIPAPALLVVTLLFPALLAWSAATVAAEFGRALTPASP